MKMFLFSLVLSICSLNVFAETVDQPTGFNKMLSILSQVAKPQDALGKTFILGTPAGKEKNILHILPENAVETLSIGQGSYQVRILKIEPFYDMDYYNDTGSVSLDDVQFSWTDKGTLPPEMKQGQECVNLLKFSVNGSEFTQENLNKYKASNTPYKLDFNHSVLKQSLENEFSFTRLTNDPAIVTLTLFKKDGSVFAKKDSSPVAICSVLPQKQGPYQWSQWSQWTEFNSCSALCGGGTQTRTRACLTENIGVSCVGNAFEETACNEQVCEDMTPMTQKQKEQLKIEGIAINITSFTRLSLFTPKGTANYEAALSNPFNRKIRCDINIVSASGREREYQSIDHRSHFGIEVPARGLTTVSGAIAIKKIKDDTGMNWTDKAYARWNYYPDNCMFID